MRPPASPPAEPPGARVEAYRRSLVRWFRKNARDLPWRRDPTAYAVWVSEAMLQQTRVETVVPYFERFLVRFPDLPSLAASSEEEVMEAWSGLGYYRRARALREGARAVMKRHDGEFPESERDALALPGVGPYTAGAVRSIALGIRAPVLDGNVTRVLSRVFGVDGDVSRAPTRRALWWIAERVVERGRPAEVNQAQMELGALVCRPRTPSCGTCPVRVTCAARRTGRVEELPRLPPRRATVRVSRDVLLVRRGREVLLRRRKSDELLPGMWDLPGTFTGDADGASEGPARAAALLPFPVQVGRELGTVRHAVTYRRITLRVLQARPKVSTRVGKPGPDGAELAWRTVEDALGRALSSPARRILTRWGGS